MAATWTVHKPSTAPGADDWSPLVFFTGSNAQFALDTLMQRLQVLDVQDDPLSVIRDVAGLSIYEGRSDRKSSRKERTRGHIGSYPVQHPSNNQVCFVLLQFGSSARSGGRIGLYIDNKKKTITRGHGFTSGHSKRQPAYSPDWDLFATSIPAHAPSGWRSQ